MASPGEFKGQRKGSCGHIMAAFDNHDKCARCHEKKIGQDQCVLGNPCVICDGFSDLQKEKLATPSYKIRKERKAGLLVSPKEVTVISSVDAEEEFLDTSAQVSVHPSGPIASASSSQPQSFVTAQQFEGMNDKWAEQFARFEALLSRGNVFTTPKTIVSTLPCQAMVSSQPFINPSVHHTGPVVVPADKGSGTTFDYHAPVVVNKRIMSAKAFPDPGPRISHAGAPVLIPGSGDESQEPIFQPVQPEESMPTGLEPLKKPSVAFSQSSLSKSQKRTGQDSSSTGHVEPAPYPPAPGASLGLSDQTYRDLPQQELYEELSGEESDSNFEEGEVSSEVIDRQDQTEDMTYRETVRSVRSFMGWSHIPVYESDLSEPDKSNNPWKGKNPKKPARLLLCLPMTGFARNWKS